MPVFDSFYYVASGRLGVWDTFTQHAEVVSQRLQQLLRQHGGASIEADGDVLYQSNDPDVVALGAILDKLVSRGHPTLVDLDYERAVVAAQEALRTEPLLEKSHGRLVGPSYVECSVPGAELFAAAEKMFGEAGEGDLSTHQAQARNNLAGNGVSDEEDLFYEAFGEAFPLAAQARLRRQVPLRELVGTDTNRFYDSRVDFALDLGRLRWVFEVDGVQHEGEGQHRYDDERDKALRAAGWQVARPTASQVREDALGWLEAWGEDLSQEELDALRGPAEEELAEQTARALILRPHRMQQAMRGWVQLLLLNVFPLSPGAPLRLLLLAEDEPGAVEALDSMLRMWEALATLTADVPAPPQVHVDLLGPAPLAPCRSEVLVVTQVDEAADTYDLVVSHATTLFTGEEGALEAAVADVVKGRRVRMRISSETADTRGLQWSPRLDYDLEDLEAALRDREENEPLTPALEVKYEALQFFLQHLFRKNDFWDGQARVIARLLRGESAIVLLPTGGGKSLTYQFSGLLLPGVTLVIDPLVALMVDQVENLQNQTIDRVGQISSLLSSSAKKDAMEDLRSGRLHFLFVAPERLQMPDMRQSLQTLTADIPISLAVVDEVHCVSEWGHDFRASYLHMGRNIQRYCTPRGGRPPTLAGLTGTASFAVLTDVQVELGISEEEAIILPVSFDRKELTFHVETVPAKGRRSALTALRGRLPRILRENAQTFFQPRGTETNGGIIFCPHANGSLGVTQVASWMGHNNYFCGRKPKAFKGNGKEWRDRKLEVQRAFKYDKIQELVATKSFGMGIDKPNIRYTMHYGIPQSIEGFYQEAGRAGRNGRERWAHCFIVYADDNWPVAQQILEEPDHRRALKMLEQVNWKDRGDILHQLWFLFNAYADREEEKTYALSFWEEHLAPAVAGMPVGSTNTADVPFAGEQEKREKAIYRLVLLGVVEDYAVIWHKYAFEVTVRRPEPTDIAAALRRYLGHYKFDEYAERVTASLSMEDTSTTLRQAIELMVDFVYDDIVIKRKQALRTMAELCRSFTSDELFREAVLAYLQDSEFTPVLKQWVNQPFEQVGTEAVREVLDQLETLEQVKRLVGTTRRMLDEDPSNLALRLLSVSARLRSPVEGDGSVLQEYRAFLKQLDDVQGPVQATLVLSVLGDAGTHRGPLLEDMAMLALRRLGTGDLAVSLHGRLGSDHLSPQVQGAFADLLEGDLVTRLQRIPFLHVLTTRSHAHA